MNPHPFLTFTPIPQAMSMAIDRARIAEDLYGFAAKPACNLITAPPRYASTANDGCLVQDIEGAKKLLDDSGVLDTDGDGVREYNGVPCGSRTRPPSTPSGRTPRPWSAIGGERLGLRPS